MLRQGAAKNHATKPQIVEFSNLDNNNKAQFLEFLLRNNITFENNGKSKNDFVAKITIHKPESDKQKENTNKLSKKSGKDHLKSKSKGLQIMEQNTLEKINRIGTPKRQKPSPNHQTSVIRNSGTPLKQKKVDKQMLKTNKINENSYSRTQESKIILTNNKTKQPNEKVRTTAFEANEISKSIHKTPGRRKEIANTTSSISKDKSSRTYNASASIIKALKPNSGRGRQLQNQVENQEYSMERIAGQGNSNRSSHNLTHGGQNKKGVVVTKEKKIEANNQIKKKTEEQKEVSELAKKYLKLFQLKLLGQRPIKWGLSQLLKVIQEIYNDLFSKNTQILSQKSHKKQSSCRNFTKFIKEWFSNKFKNQKLATTNLINLLYSLSYYTQSEKKLVTGSKSFVKQERTNHELTVSGIFLQTFEDFLCQIYEYEDLLFFLFVRNIVISQVNNLTNLNSKKIRMQKESKVTLIEKQIILTYEDIQKILSIIFVDDNELIEQYKSIVLNYIHSINLNMKSIQNLSQIQNEIKLSGPNFMHLLLQDYCSKRVTIQRDVFEQEEYKLTKNDYQSFKSENTFEQLIHNQFLPYKKQYSHERPEKKGDQSKRHLNFNENETVQLTFGEDTQSNMQKLLQTQHNEELCRSFWEISEENNLQNKLQNSSVEYLIYEKLRKKIKQFICMLSEGKSQNNSIDEKKLQSIFSLKQKGPLLDPKTYVFEVFSKKAFSLLSSLFEMNKIRWFEELKVDDPSQQDIEKVEELQLMYRRLKSNPEAEGIGKLCKNIITIPQLMAALEKIICI